MLLINRLKVTLLCLPSKNEPERGKNASITMFVKKTWVQTAFEPEGKSWVQTARALAQDALCCTMHWKCESERHWRLDAIAISLCGAVRARVRIAMQSISLVRVIRDSQTMAC